AALFAVALTCQFAWAASGRIEGKATDIKTGEALPGVTVQLEGTSLGAATDLNGRYFISNVPDGSYTLKASYVGYKTLTVGIRVIGNELLQKDLKMEAVGVTTKEVVVTAQASGRNAAINQQLTSNNEVDVVSAARIQQLPDANAAESVGRLPGISLVRSGGEATEVVIRGLQPQYNMVTIDGIPIPANEAGSSSNFAAGGGRGVNLSMISSTMLKGIQVYKTVTPDMDAAVLGGTVNFDIREAQATPNGVPGISLQAQGGYNNLMNTYNDYKYVGSIEKRFFDNSFGVFAQGIIQRQNLTSDQLGGNYYLPDVTKPNNVALGSLNLTFYPREQQLYDGTLTMDYRLPQGKVDLVNIVSQTNTSEEYHNEVYNLQGYGNSIGYNAQYDPYTLNVITNILNYEQRFSGLRLTAKLANAFSETNYPGQWSIGFSQNSAGTSNILNTLNPAQVGQAAAKLTNFNNMLLYTLNAWSAYTKQRNLTGEINISKDFNFSDFVRLHLKAGGMFTYTSRAYNYSAGSGSIFGTSDIIAAYPWMTQPPYNLSPLGNQQIPFSVIAEPTMKFGNFLNGDYMMNSSANMTILANIARILKAAADTLKTPPTGGAAAYTPNVFANQASNYSGTENRSAGYIMGILSIGNNLTIIPGVRYQGLLTSYTANQFLNASATNPFPNPLPHSTVTRNQYHGYWLPDINVRYDPLSWLSVRAAYTNTLSYPNFNQIIPVMDVYSASVTWNNYALKPATSQNWDFEVSAYDNSIGLLAISPFLKHIDNLVFYQSSFITNPADYPGIPKYTRGFSIGTYINNPFPVDLWGIEAEWQTHFWYLPGPLSGLVLNVNYTHIFSKARYPYTYTTNTGFPLYQPVYVDTFYVDRLIQQPNDIANLSIGYDYDQFSILVSMIYQSNVYYGTDFFNSLRSDLATYTRWDVAVNQGLPWDGVSLFLNLNNLNSESNIYLIRGSGFPTSESDYGMTASLGIRWRFQ
ncbi:MAG: TonB-dependent receptor, partial [Bacteroidetes bacterium]|nr:TonB-dependent receptor [Bacteroidota bacterium]